jgi:hypothetical protein
MKHNKNPIANNISLPMKIYYRSLQYVELAPIPQDTRSVSLATNSSSQRGMRNKNETHTDHAFRFFILLTANTQHFVTVMRS